MIFYKIKITILFILLFLCWKSSKYRYKMGIIVFKSAKKPKIKNLQFVYKKMIKIFKNIKNDDNLNTFLNNLEKLNYAKV
jgi:hypothetical protein